MFSASRMYSLRILDVPDESVAVMFALGRSKMTVSLRPEVTAGPVPAVPGSRGVGRICVPIGVSCPVPVLQLPHDGTPGGPGGGTTGWPLFQFVSVLQSPLLSFIQTAGMSWSLTHSLSPCETSTSVLEAIRLLPFSFIVLAYCQKFHGCVVP